MLDFFLLNEISPKETLGPSMRSLENSVKGRINALISIIRDIEKNQTKPTTAMLKLLFEQAPNNSKQPELTAVEPLEIPFSEDAFATSFEAIELRKKKNELKLELQQCRKEFLAFLNAIEIVKSSFGKPKLLVKITPETLENLKQHLKKNRMYISITKQHLDSTFSQSSGDFVAYLEKENQGKAPELQEHFFDQSNGRISAKQVIDEIDHNTAKLKKRDPKFYSLTINPSQRELKHIENNPELLKKYVREVMKDYAASFYQDVPVTVDQIKYFAKIEYERTFKGFDREIKENQPYYANIIKLEHDIVKIRNGEGKGNIRAVQKNIERLKKQAPHHLNGKMIVQGMQKPGLQTHIHIIVSRKDRSNRYSLSPRSSYKSSQATLNGKPVKRGFDRSEFYKNAEKTFDRLFLYKRNFAETYQARNLFLKEPYKYFAQLMKLPINERSLALKILGKSGVKIPMANIPTNQVQLALKAIKQFRKVIDRARDAGAIGI